MEFHAVLLTCNNENTGVFVTEKIKYCYLFFRKNFRLVLQDLLQCSMMQLANMNR